MPNTLKTSDRSIKTTAVLVIVLGFMFMTVGCAQIYKTLGLTEQQTAEQLTEDKKTIIRTITTVRTTTADLITSIVAGIGAIASGFLAKWLGTERKITKSLIQGIENAATTTTKQDVKEKAIANGVNKALTKRVAALT